MVTVQTGKTSVVADFLARRMDQLGLTQYQLAKRSGVGQGHLSKILGGDYRLPTKPTRDKINAVLGLADRDWFAAAGVLPASDAAAGPAALRDELAPERLAMARAFVADSPRATLAAASRLPGMLDITDPLNVAKILAYVEGKPDHRFQEFLAGRREVIPDVAYVRGVIRIYAAWSSNADLLLEGLDMLFPADSRR